METETEASDHRSYHFPASSNMLSGRSMAGALLLILRDCAPGLTQMQDRYCKGNSARRPANVSKNIGGGWVLGRSGKHTCKLGTSFAGPAKFSPQFHRAGLSGFVRGGTILSGIFRWDRNRMVV